MKRLLMIVAALLVFGSVAYAQQSKSDEKLEFKPHWSFKLQGGASYTTGEADFGKLLSPAAQLSGTYNFHHAMGVRAALGGWQGRGAVVVADEVYKFNFVQLSADYVVDVANLFAGFKHDRVVSPYVFAGLGIARGFDNGEAEKLAVDYSNVLTKCWDKETFLAGRLGLGADYRLNEKFSIGLEAIATCYGENFNSKPTYRDAHVDWQYTLLAGITYRLGGNTRDSKAYLAAQAAEKEAIALAKKAEEERIAAEKAAAEKAAAEKAAAEKAAAEKAAAEKAAAEKAAAERAALAAENSVNIFFYINSSYINKAESKKLETLAQWMKEHPDFTVSIEGYADKKTGTSSYNMTVSQNRAKAVMNRLVKLGVSAERISTAFMGDTKSPFAENSKNRVVICTLK